MQRWGKSIIILIMPLVLFNTSILLAENPFPAIPLLEDVEAEAALLKIEPGLLEQINQQKKWDSFEINSIKGIEASDRFSYVTYGNHIYYVVIRGNPFVMMGRAPTLEMMQNFKKTRICTFLLPEADCQTFQIMDFGYAKDQKQVYYRGALMKNADPASFQILYDQYAKDKDHVYLMGNLLEKSDANTFRLFSKSAYGKDRQRVYFNGNLVENADSDSFQVIDPFYEYGKDKDTVYFSGRLIAGADVDSFEVLNWRFSRDNNAVYLEGSKMDGIDSGSFESIHVGSSPYSYKDQNGVYYDGDGGRKKIGGANPATFELLKNSYGHEGPYGKDDKRVYFWEKVVKGADPDTFVMLTDTNYGVDKDHMYYGYSWSEVDKDKGWESNFLSHQVPMLFAEKRYDLAVKYLTKLLGMKKERWLHEDGLLVQRGKAYFEQGQYDLALIDYNKAIQIQSKHSYHDHRFASAFLGRGKIYLASKEYDKAIADGLKAKYHDSYNFEVCELLANTYAALGDKQTAIQEYEELLSRIIKNGIDPNSSSFKEHKSKIERKIMELGK